MIHIAAPAAGPTPFAVAVVETADGRVTARLVDVACAALRVGATVRVEADERYGLVAFPAD